mgnify:CR=1 FL=1
MSNHFIFVYGTLKQGKGNNYLLCNDTFLKEDTVKGRMYNLGNYPAVTYGDDIIHGELWRISKHSLLKLDRLEGVPYLYQRIKTKTSDGRIVWIYIQGHLSLPERAKYLPSGIWE